MQGINFLLGLAAVVAPFVGAAPIESRGPADREVIPDSYLIRLKPDVSLEAILAHKNQVRSIHARNLGKRGVTTKGIGHSYGIGKYNGYSGHFDVDTIKEIEALDDVQEVEPDFLMHINEIVTQDNAPWGLASISSREPGGSAYKYDSSAGEGQTAYIVDTGVRISHNEFEGRAELGFNAVEGSEHEDTIGHGTHVAGTVAGATFGVAKKAKIVSVKVFAGSSGSASEVMAGFDWAVNDIVEKGIQNSAVINLSLGGPASSTWDNAITESFGQGVLSVVAAGNDGADAENSSPARSPEAITVGNIEVSNARAESSNFGAALDIFAPGTDIESAWFDGDDSTNTITGTSMASPHVAGLVAYLRGAEGELDAQAVSARVAELGTPDVVTDAGSGSVNLLAFNGAE